MPDKASNVVLNFKMKGQVEYAQTIREINAIMNTAAKEYKNHIAAMGADATATDKLRAEKKKLEVQLEAAHKRTQMLRDQYEAMSNSTKTTAGQLAQMYAKLLDAENAEIKLQKSLERVNEGLSEEAQEARQAKEILNQLQNESKTLEAEQKALTSSFKLQQSQLGDNASEAEKLALAQKQLSQQMELTDRIVANLEKQLEQAKKVYGDNSREVLQLQSKINDAKTKIADLSKSLGSVQDSGKKAEDGMKGFSKVFSAGVLVEASEALGDISEKLIDIAHSAADFALVFGDSQTYLQANLGLTEDEAEKLNDVVKDVFKNGVVGSVEEAAEAVMLVKQQFGDLNNTDLEKITNNITAIAKRTGTDVNENVRAAKQMMTAFGISGQEATDLIAAGFQNGLNRSDDFLDTLNEYSPHFAAAGFSAKQMLEILNNGLKNGSLNTDKAADAVKEFQIRLGDGSFKKIVGSFSKDTQDMFKKWQDGKATVADVAESVSKDLNKMTPSKQQEALSLLSSQFEDLGVNGAKALFSVGDAFEDTAGKADEMAKKSPGEKWESSLRELKENLVPIGQSLVDAFTPFIDVLSKMANWFDKLPGPVKTFVAVFGSLLAVAAALTPVIIALTVAVGALDVALLPIAAVVLGVAAAIAGLIVVIKNWGKITDWLSDKWKSFSKWISKLVGDIASWFSKKFKDIFGSVKDNFNKIKSTASDIWASIKSKIADFVGGIKDSAISKFNSLRSSISSIFNKVRTAIVTPIQKARDTIKGIVDKIKGFFSGLKIKLPHIKLPHFKIQGKFDLIPPHISVPKLSIDWYAKGGIFTQPTIFGYSNGRLKGAGDSGPEAALPLNEETLGAIGRGIAATMKNINQASRPIILQIDGKTFAQITGDYFDAQGGMRIRRIERGLA